MLRGVYTKINISLNLSRVDSKVVPVKEERMAYHLQFFSIFSDNQSTHALFISAQVGNQKVKKNHSFSLCYLGIHRPNIRHVGRPQFIDSRHEDALRSTTGRRFVVRILTVEVSDYFVLSGVFPADCKIE